MFNFGGWEWLVLLAIVLIVFGVGRLPEIGGAIGKGIREFRDNVKAGSGTADKAKENAENTHPEG